MRALLTFELLRVWEQGRTLTPTQRALALLAAACPDTSTDVLASLSIGQRDACLLTLREWAFGSQFTCLAICPACDERLELAFNVADIRASAEDKVDDTLSLSADGYEVHFRLPNSMDLIIVAGPDVLESRRQLFERCLVTVQQCGEAAPSEQLPSSVVDAIVERMAQADPQADVQLALACPECGHEWRAVFDIVSFFWNEISAWAQRVLHEVHILALAYGWREADILAMSPWRRQFYLSLQNGSRG